VRSLRGLHGAPTGGLRDGWCARHAPGGARNTHDGTRSGTVGGDPEGDGERLALLCLRIGRATLRAEAVRTGVVTWAGEASYTEVTELADAIARLAAEDP